jgi:nuclear GTP-binding protein
MAPTGKNSSDNPDRVKTKGDTHKRDKAKIKLLRLYRGGKPIRDKEGHIIGGDFIDRAKSGNVDWNAETGRVRPDRRWFGNTRTVSAPELDKFREVMSKNAADPYTVILRSKAIPLGLLTDAKTSGRAHLLSAESFSTTFGPHSQRKRPKLLAPGLEDLVSKATEKAAAYEIAGPGTGTGSGVAVPAFGAHTGPLTRAESDADRAPVFKKGTSGRIWGELHKVLDSSDVVCIVLDARDPAGTRCPHVERHLKENAGHKQVVFVLNKVDLVPTWVTRRWVASLSAEYPTLAFHAGNMTKPFGKGALIALLRQLSKLHSDKKAISVGFVGYPNVGKSSIINALKMKKVCNVAPIPGETKVWQYITLMKRVFLIDCPGVVYEASGDSELALVLKGVVRAEKLVGPEHYIQGILDRVKKEHVAATYGVPAWADGLDFLEQLAKRTGRLLPGGEANVGVTAINVINDWQRGKLPFYTPPPEVKRVDKLGVAGVVAAAATAAAAAEAEAAAAGRRATTAELQPVQDLRRVGRHGLLEAEEEEALDEGEAEEGGVEEDEEEREGGEDGASAQPPAPPALSTKEARSAAQRAASAKAGGKRRRDGPTNVPTAASRAEDQGRRKAKMAKPSPKAPSGARDRADAVLRATAAASAAFDEGDFDGLEM